MLILVFNDGQLKKKNPHKDPWVQIEEHHPLGLLNLVWSFQFHPLATQRFLVKFFC